ncbi:MAG TPA: OmpA family protein [Saprospiraceae bacterium]|nr:OmpA family protein [Saprospiraceae bacterium]
MRYIPYLFLFIFSLAQSEALHAQSLKKVQRIEGIPPKVQYRAITHDPSGNMYVATSADVFMIPANSNKAQPMSAGDNIMDVDWSADNGLIMLVKEGSIRFVSSGKVLSLEQGIEANCMDVTKSTIWVGTTNGVYTVSIDKEKILDHYTTEDGVLLNNQINFIHTDPFNVRWVGTEKGVARIAGKKWKLFEEEQAITAITSTSEGAWMAADQNMWLVNSYNRWFPIDAWKDLVKGRVRALSSDSKGLLYIASDILVKYDPYQEKILTMNDDSATAQFILLAQGPGKNIWMASHNGMSRVIEDTTKVIAPVISSEEFSAVVEVLSTPVCNGMATGHVRAKVTGGQLPYTYKWSYGSSKESLITDLSPGLYQVTVIDGTGKTTVASGIVSASPDIKIIATSDGNASDKLAADGKAGVTISGGKEPFQITWDNDETSSSAIKLTEGIHSVRVMDDNGCIATTNVSVNAEKVLKSLDIATLELGQTIRLDKLYFEADSSTIQPSSYAVLEEMYEFLKNNDKVIIEIGGHTNSLPEDDYCDRLSTSRAKNIALYLYDKGIPQSQISYKGYGKRQPVATNQTVEGRRKNQRVEIKIVSL